MSGILNSLLQGYGAGSQIRKERDAQQKQSKLAELMQRAYSAPSEQRRDLIGQAIGVDPQAGFALQGQLSQDEDRRAKALVRSARMIASAPESMRPQIYAGMLPEFQALGIQGLPPQYDASVAESAQKIVEAWAGIDDGASGVVHSQRVGADGNIYNTMRNGKMVNTGIQADRQMWLRDHPGMPPELVGKDGVTRQIGQQQLPSGPNVQAHSDAVAAAANQMQQAGIPAEQIEAWIAQVTGGTAAPAQARPSEAQTAAQVEMAKRQVQLSTLPDLQAIETRGAIDLARGKAQAEAGVNVEIEAGKKARDAQATMDLLDKAESLLRGGATGGIIGATKDRALGAFNVSTKGAQATAGLKLIAAELVSKVPRFEGPQSNIDVQFYREAAGDLANDALPVEQRLAALKVMRELRQKYTSSQSQQAQPKQGGWSIQRVD